MTLPGNASNPVSRTHVQIGRKVVDQPASAGSSLASTSRQVAAVAQPALSQIAKVFGVDVRLSIRNHTVRPFWLANEKGLGNAVTMIQKLVHDAALRDRGGGGPFAQSVKGFMDLDTGALKPGREAEAAATEFLKRLELRDDRLVIHGESSDEMANLRFPKETILQPTDWETVLPTLTSAFTGPERASENSKKVDFIARRLFQEVSQHSSHPGTDGTGPSRSLATLAFANPGERSRSSSWAMRESFESPLIGALKSPDSPASSADRPHGLRRTSSADSLSSEHSTVSSGNEYSSEPTRFFSPSVANASRDGSPSSRSVSSGSSPPFSLAGAPGSSTGAFRPVLTALSRRTGTPTPATARAAPVPARPGVEADT